MARTKVGVSLRSELVDDLDDLVEECADLDASRSEIVEAILLTFFSNNQDAEEMARQLVISNRKRSNS